MSSQVKLYLCHNVHAALFTIHIVSKQLYSKIIMMLMMIDVYIFMPYSGIQQIRAKR